jgi:hypothetical protein
MDDGQPQKSNEELNPPADSVRTSANVSGASAAELVPFQTGTLSRFG